jgi:hypothetical protein
MLNCKLHRLSVNGKCPPKVYKVTGTEWSSPFPSCTAKCKEYFQYCLINRCTSSLPGLHCAWKLSLGSAPHACQSLDASVHTNKKLCHSQWSRHSARAIFPIKNDTQYHSLQTGINRSIRTGKSEANSVCRTCIAVENLDKKWPFISSASFL